MLVHTATLTILHNLEFMNASRRCMSLHLGGPFLSNKVRLCVATFLTTDNLAANTGQVLQFSSFITYSSLSLQYDFLTSALLLHTRGLTTIYSPSRHNLPPSSFLSSFLSCHRTVSPLDYLSHDSHVSPTFHHVLRPSTQVIHST